MRGINKVIVVGHLGQDPEVRFTPNGKAVANLSLATSESWKDQQGQVQEKTEWHRISIFGKLAEIAGEYLKKGSQVYIEGKLQTRKWQDQQGQDRYTTEIVLDPFNGVMQMLGSNQQRQGNQGGYQQQQGNQGGYQQQQQQQQANQGGYQQQQQPQQQQGNQGGYQQQGNQGDQGGYQQQPQQQRQQQQQQPQHQQGNQGGYQQQQQPQQQPPVQAGGPDIDYDDDIPFGFKKPSA